MPELKAELLLGKIINNSVVTTNVCCRLEIFLESINQSIRNFGFLFTWAEGQWWRRQDKRTTHHTKHNDMRPGVCAFIHGSSLILWFRFFFSRRRKIVSKKRKKKNVKTKKKQYEKKYLVVYSQQKLKIWSLSINNFPQFSAIHNFMLVFCAIHSSRLLITRNNNWRNHY